MDEETSIQPTIRADSVDTHIAPVVASNLRIYATTYDPHSPTPVPHLSGCKGES